MQRILGLAPAYDPSQQLPPLPVLGRPRRGNRPVQGGKANRSVGTMLSMPLDSAWLFARGEQARLTKKFDLYGHRRYHERRDCEKAGEKEKEAQLCPLPMIHSAPSAARP